MNIILCKPFRSSNCFCPPPDIDECTAGTDKCDFNADCSNTDGSYSCSCKPGYLGDGLTCTGELCVDIVSPGQFTMYS